MRNGILVLALSAPLMFGAAFGSTPVASEDGNAEACAASPAAITTLPVPLSRWAQVRCTSAGYIITGREGWIWVEPNHKALVVIPSQTFGDQADLHDSTSYFTKF